MYIFFTIFICHCFIDQGKDDDKAFIFTLKNPHRVDPTRFMKKKGRNAIYGSNQSGPLFGYGNFDICVCDNNNTSNCWINNNGTNGYDCHQIYKESLFVGTAKAGQTNKFIVSDYEVFTYN